ETGSGLVRWRGRGWAAYPSPLTLPAHSNILVEQNRVSVGVMDDEMGRSCRVLAGLCLKGDAAFFELALDLAHVGEGIERLGVLVPTRREGQHVLFEHPLEETYDDVPVFHNQPVLGHVAAEGLEPQLLVKGARRRDVLHGQAKRKGTQFHFPYSFRCGFK